MKTTLLIWMTGVGMAVAASDPLAVLEQQIAEQERQIQRLEIENARLRIMLTETDHVQGDPLYGTEVSRPTGGQVAAEPPSHQVAEGETLSGIAARYGVALDALASHNEIADPSRIRVGQRLILPAPIETARRDRGAAQAPETAAEPPAARPVSKALAADADAKKPRAAAKVHTVQAGENLYRVSLRYGVALQALLDANPGLDPRRLQVGQRVRLPGMEEPVLVDRR